MKYRILGLLGVMALTAGSLQAQDYDDIYYDASKAPKTTKKVKVETPVKTVAVYGEVPEKYKVVVKDNYREERDVDEYNRRGAYEPQYEIDINGDTIYMDSTYVDDDMFANTRRIERFYNPDVVILSDDDDLVELYYDESPTINLIVGSDWGYSSYGWSTSYYPWYTGWYEPWYTGWYGWYSPWHYGWYSPWHGWGYPIYHGYWYHGWYDHWGWGHNYYGWYDRPWGGHFPGFNPTYHPGGSNHYSNYGYTDHRRGGLAPNRNQRPRVDASGSRNQVAARGTGSSRTSGVGMPGSRNRSGGVSSRSGNMGSRSSSGVSSRSSSGVSRSSSSSSYGGSRSSGSYNSGSSRSSGSYNSGSSSRGSGGSYSSGSSGGSRSSGGGGGGSHGGSSGGGGRRH